jgi:hypothetical protein
MERISDTLRKLAICGILISTGGVFVVSEFIKYLADKKSVKILFVMFVFLVYFYGMKKMGFKNWLALFHWY